VLRLLSEILDRHFLPLAIVALAALFIAIDLIEVVLR